MAGGPGGGMPPPGGDPLGGMGGPPGGGMPPPGGDPLGGMGGPGGGMGGGAPGGLNPQVHLQLKSSDVWTVLEEILEGKPDKKTSKEEEDMVQQQPQFLMR